MRKKIIKTIVYIVMVLGSLNYGCIEEFDPEIKDYEDILVIDGTLIKGVDLQKVLVSRSTGVYGPDFNPASGCLVKVLDNSGNEFVFEETEKGAYTASIPDAALTYNAEYQLYVKTPNGDEYLSDPEPILESSPVDSVYYLTEEYQSSSEESEVGLRFYADLKAPDEATKNYRWELEETWEIHTFYDIDGFWDKNSYHLPWYSPREGLSLCWDTKRIRQYYTSSTENLVVNEKKKIPLSYIQAKDPKLDFKYSLLIKQYALSNEAYKYHSQNNFATEGTEGLFQTQPGQSKGNIHNINKPDELVLGFFWASSYTEKRLFFSGPLTGIHANCDEVVPCIPQPGQSLLQYFRGLGRDLYLVALDFSWENPDSVSLWGFPRNQICIDCTHEGASTVKPDFWE